MDAKRIFEAWGTSDAVLLAVIPFVGSFLALIFETGYLTYYGAPLTYIQIDFPRIITASMMIALLLALFAAVIWFMGFYFSIFGKRREQEEPSMNKSESPVVPFGLSDKIILSGIVVFFFMVLSFQAGLIAADKTAYWVVEDEPEMIVITTYGDTLLLKKIDLAKREITDSFEIRSVKESKQIKMKKVETGRLHRPDPPHVNAVKSWLEKLWDWGKRRAGIAN